MLRNQGGHEGQQPGAQLELERVCRVYLQVVPLLPQHDVKLVEEVDPGLVEVEDAGLSLEVIEKLNWRWLSP